MTSRGNLRNVLSTIYYSHSLDYNKNWYANHDLLCRYPKSNRRADESAVFQLFSSELEVRKVNIADLQDSNGKQPSYRWFNGRRQKAYILSGDETMKSKRRTAGIQRVSDHQQDSQHVVLRVIQRPETILKLQTVTMSQLVPEAHSHESL
ncbi:Hypothetical predicted protein [Paramuricea clavata]|uniref:Uncharacterized protein n=1 Tax=Paramuricea clavata TaxID=317549 RepID=A0A7D9I4T7_PARCT|nr:Hypothetical predicted protein [Paramuricea clavata]